jgi:hypothetical protein
MRIRDVVENVSGHPHIVVKRAIISDRVDGANEYVHRLGADGGARLASTDMQRLTQCHR